MSPWYSQRERDVCRNLRDERSIDSHSWRNRQGTVGGAEYRDRLTKHRRFLHTRIVVDFMSFEREGGAVSMKNTVKVVTIMVALSATSVLAADWPWLYGPRRNHTSEQKGLLRTWPQEGPKVLWTVPLAAGFGGPAVSGGNVYVSGPRREGWRHAARARSGERQGTVDVRL